MWLLNTSKYRFLEIVFLAASLLTYLSETKPGRPALDGMGIDIPGGAKIGITGRTGRYVISM